MISSSNKISILIAGASGKLGTLLTREALKKSNLQVNILVRNPDKIADFAEEVKKSGGNVIKGDISDAASLKDVTKGIHTVISSITAYDEKVYVGGHIALIKDAEANGVTRFVPNWFCTNVKAIPREEISKYGIYERKSKIEDYLDTTNLKKLSIFCGVFMETFFFYQKVAPGYWGEPNHVLNLTSYGDTAAYTIAAVANKDETGDLHISGDDLTAIQAVEVYNKVRDTSTELKRSGSMVELKNLYEESLKANNFQKAALMTLHSMVYDDRTYYSKNDDDKYPEIKFNKFEDFVKQHPDLVI